MGLQSQYDIKVAQDRLSERLDKTPLVRVLTGSC